MRLLIRFQLEREANLPLDHQEQLAGLVYRLLGESDTEYARFLHDEGYRLEDQGNRRYKLFVFSTLRVPKGRRRVEGALLRVAPGEVQWLIASPRSDFLTHAATGLFAVGQTVQVGHIPLTIAAIECLPEPVFHSPMRFTCITPIVASVPREDRSTRYLTPPDPQSWGEGNGPSEFSEAVRRNLLRKYELVQAAQSPSGSLSPDGESAALTPEAAAGQVSATGADSPLIPQPRGNRSVPVDDRLELVFDADYLARSPHGGTKLTTFKGIHIRGVLAPFTLTGSEELMRVAWDCGLGEKNSAGFGMIEGPR